jgi:L-2-hydroxyglutarate oxidase LhgO
MEKTSIIIIGAGAVGCAAAERLSIDRKDIVVVERHDAFGRETSSRNSEVIHAGFYYPYGSLKASLCVEGSGLLRDFCRVNGVAYRQCGKLVVARSPDEDDRILKLLKQGIANGVRGLSLVNSGRLAELEPAVKGRIALLS